MSGNTITKVETMTDLEIVEKVKNGDRAAFSTLVIRHQKALFRMCFRFLKETAAAEDVVQESFIKAFSRIHLFEARAAFKSWLFQIAINTARNKLRDRDVTSELSERTLGVGAEAENSLVHAAISTLLQTYIEKLPYKQKTALMLRVYEDLSFKEIAEIMDCPYDTAKANYRHALLRLKDELKGHSDLKFWSEEDHHQITEWSDKTIELEA